MPKIEAVDTSFVALIGSPSLQSSQVLRARTLREINQTMSDSLRTDKDSELSTANVPGVATSLCYTKEIRFVPQAAIRVLRQFSQSEALIMRSLHTGSKLKWIEGKKAKKVGEAEDKHRAKGG